MQRFSYTPEQTEVAAKEMWQRIVNDYGGEKGIAGVILCHRLLKLTDSLSGAGVDTTLQRAVHEMEGWVDGSWEDETKR